MKYFVFLIFLLTASLSNATTWASDGTQSGGGSSVQALHDSGSFVAGDTITIPAGTFNWTGTLTLTKAVTLQGAGVGSTFITSDITSALINVTLVSGYTTTIRDIKFTHGGTATESPHIRVYGTNDTRRFVMRDCEIVGLKAMAFEMWTVLGVVSNTVMSGACSVVGAQVYGSSWGDAIHSENWGDKSWAASEAWGTDGFIYFEDCTFTSTAGYSAAMDAHKGGRYAIRESTLHKVSLQTHGTEAQRTRSGRAFEVYNNTFTGDDGYGGVSQFRGGTTLWHNNTISGWTTSAAMQLVEYAYYNPRAMTLNAVNANGPWDVSTLNSPSVTGTATAAPTAFSMTDNTKSWSPAGTWKNYLIYKTGGPSVKSISSVSQSGSTITVNCTGHGLATGEIVSITGATDYNEWNGKFNSVVVNDANQFTISNGGGAFRYPPTGSLTCTKGHWYMGINDSTTDTITWAQGLYPSYNDGTNELFLGVNDTYAIFNLTQSMDQVGTGASSDLLGAYTPATPGGGFAQVVSPAYSIRNYRSGNVVPFSTGRAGGTGLTHASIRENTHYYDEETSFTGSVGTGSGTLAARPASGLTAGVGYWATDQGEWNSTNGATPDGQLFVATGPTAWALYYTPYQYPHPLISGAPDITAPTLTAAAVNGSTLSLTFSESVVNVNALFWTPSAGYCTAASGSGANWTMTIIPAASFGSSYTLNYSPGTVQDAAGNALASITARAITNNTPSPGTAERTPGRSPAARKVMRR